MHVTLNTINGALEVKLILEHPSYLRGAVGLDTCGWGCVSMVVYVKFDVCSIPTIIVVLRVAVINT